MKKMSNTVYHSLINILKQLINFVLKIWKNKHGKIGMIMLFILIFFAVLAPFLSPYSPYDYDISNQLQEPSKIHWLGTDRNGVDILTQIIYGTRISLIIGLVTGVSVTLVGAILGVISGYFSKVVSAIVLNLANILMVIPTLPLMIILNDISSSYAMMIFIFIVFGWGQTTRVVRAQTLSIISMNYVKQAELSNASKFYVMKKHILPGVIHLLVINCALSCAGFMIAEAGLSFIGLGDPSTISWGKILVAAERSAFTSRLWAWILAPGFAIFFAVTTFMQIGYAIEEIFNPKIKINNKINPINKEIIIKELETIKKEEVPKKSDNLLEVKNLRIMFNSEKGVLKAVKGIDFNIKKGESIAIVGESGSGKSVSVLAILKLLRSLPAIYEADKILFSTSNGLVDLSVLNENQIRTIRGKQISMIYQDPSAALNPVLTIGEQIDEIFIYHLKIKPKKAKEQSIKLLEEVGILEPSRIYKQFPHQMSGGMKQRILIAMAIACRPKLMIADEPTTALDVTIQKQILKLLETLKKNNEMSLLYITHDLAVAKMCADRIFVMHEGLIVEQGSSDDIINNPKHWYTKKLINAIPK